ncbi:MAG TPA: alpha/beta fold hydrolase, partial [Nocardioides sp.]|nr:alpha/beta fold hydrolase [Nocardioides sp.]
MTEPASAAPVVTVLDRVENPWAAVLVLHGGKESSRAPVTGRSLSWQRGAALGRTLARRLHDAGVAVRLLRYRSIGWNDDGTDKVADARWAIDGTGAALGPLPMVLVGHSMGGRTACQVADHPSV